MGSAMPDGSPGVHGEVLLILGEDSIAKTVRKRLEAARQTFIASWFRRSLGVLIVTSEDRRGNLPYSSQASDH